MAVYTLCRSGELQHWHQPTVLYILSVGSGTFPVLLMGAGLLGGNGQKGGTAGSPINAFGYGWGPGG